MAGKRSSGSRKSLKRPSPRRLRGEPWIQAVWGQAVPPKVAGAGRKVQLRLKRRPGKARTITVTYTLTKKALGKWKE
jgi:hypothetical protein